MSSFLRVLPDTFFACANAQLSTLFKGWDCMCRCDGVLRSAVLRSQPSVDARKDLADSG